MTAFDKASKISGMTVEFDGYFLNNEAVSVDIPKITLSKDASTLSTTFAGGTPEYVYKVGTIPSIKGVSFRSTFYNSGDGRFNVYAVDDGSCIPVVQRTYGYTKSFTESDSNSEYFTISLDNDNFIKTATVSGGDYDGTEYSYIATHGSAHGGGFRHQGHDAALFGVKRLRLKCLTGDDEAAFDLLKQFFFLHIHQSSILILMTTLRT